MRLWSVFLCYQQFISCLYAINTSIYDTVPVEAPKCIEMEPITEIVCLMDIRETLEQSGPDTLIVFDIDEVLVTSKDRFFHPLSEKMILDLTKQEMGLAKTEEEQKKIEEKLSIGLTETKRVLIEKLSPDLLRALNRKKMKAIGLTSFPSGRFGKIPQLEKWRVDHLTGLGLDFSIFFPQLQRHEFSSLKKPSLPPPLFEKGILFSRGYSKGDVLLAFLDLIHWKPHKVIFIDDLLENLRMMSLSLKARHIAFQGYHYRGAEIESHPLDKESIELQFRHLMHQACWLSDENIHTNGMLKTKCKP
jgi:hypothetical protein